MPSVYSRSRYLEFSLPFNMTNHRTDMTARVVPLRSREAGEPPCPPTASERIALVTRLSREMWALTGRPLPSYTRKTMPVVLTRRGATDD
jgi:hypothetical protein